MISLSRLPLLGRHVLLATLLIAVFAAVAEGSTRNRLLRIRMQPRAGYTRISFSFLEPPRYRMSRSERGVRLTFPGTDAPSFKKLRSYADAYLSGVYCSQRGSDLQVTVAVKGGATGVRPIPYGTLSLSLDVGGVAAQEQGRPDIVPGREPILSGTERVVREFTPPSRAALPFLPSDPKLLNRLMGKEDVERFQEAEGLLYKEKGAEALEAFTPFLSRSKEVRALASYRGGEAYYLMERYDAALKAFRDAELLWPEFLAQAPSVVEQYADTLARGGYYLAGRRLMGRLLAAYTGDSYAAPLLIRLAEMTARHGDEAAALHLYRTALERFPGTVAAGRAAMKLADRDIFSVTRDRYKKLKEKYQRIYDEPSTSTVRDEALFKSALLDALYGSYQDAIADAVGYEKLYPRGIFNAIVRQMREELVFIAYRELNQGGEKEALVKLAVEHREYLARCFSDPEFASRLATACRDTHQLSTEVELFGYLADRSFSAQSAPFIMQRLVDDALALGKQKLAETSGRTFLDRFPRHPAAGGIRELLGRLAFDRGDLKETAGRLFFLAAKGAPPAIHAESNYYLGKALLAANDNRGALGALTRFAAAAPGSPLLCDAHFGRIQALSALGETVAALKACREGLQGASGENADRFHYRMGELHLKLKQLKEAEVAWEAVVKGGREGVWRTMAQESLNDLNWRLKMARELPAPSKR